MPRIRFNGGKNTALDPSDLDNGQLQAVSNAFYKPGDQRLWSRRGNRVFGDTGSGAAVIGTHVTQFDDATDQVLAYSGTTIYGAPLGESGAFSSLITGLNASATDFSVAHALDRHYIANSYDRLKALESDLTSRDAGMRAPTDQITAVAAAAADAVARPTSSSGSASNEANSYDTDVNTYADLTLDTAGTATQSWSWASNAQGTRTLFILWKLAGLPIDGFGPEGDGGGGTGIGIGGSQDAGFNVTCKFEVSEDSGETFTTVATIPRTTAHSEPISLQTQITAANDSTVVLRATLTYTSGVNQASLRIQDVKMNTGSETANFTTSSAMLYTYVEFDETRGLPGPPVQHIEVTLTSQNQVTLTVPGTATNTTATHFIIYRTAEGGEFDALGRLGMVKVGTTTFVDDFQKFPSTVGPTPLLPMVQVAHQGVTLSIPRDTPPPLLESIHSFKGSLVGFRGRGVFFSVAGRPESWPEWNVIDSFPFEQNDNIVGGASVGDSFLVGARDLMVVMDDLPRVVSGVYNLTKPRPLKGQPGLVGKKAIVSFSVSGEDRAAWVSPFGLIQTNGVRSEWMTRDLDWPNEVKASALSDAVLEWDKEFQILRMVTEDATGTTGEWLFHMAPEHRLPSGMPKVTGPTATPTKDMGSAVTQNQGFLYSGHESDGKVYIENRGRSGEMSFKIPRLYGDEAEYETFRASIMHTDGDATATVAWTVGRDGTAHEQTKTMTVSTVGRRKSWFHPLLSGEWAEVTVTDNSGREIGYLHMEPRLRERGEAGPVAV